MEKDKLYDGKHLTKKDRIEIESLLRSGERLKAIAAHIGKDPRTVSKEIERNRTVRSYEARRNRYSYDDAFTEPCPALTRFPFTCHTCGRMKSCSRDHVYYDAQSAQSAYESRLRNSRSGIDVTADETATLDAAIADGTERGLSVYAILKANPGITKSEKTVYTYISKGILSTGPVDLRRAAKMKPRVKSGKYAKTGAERQAYKGREITDFHVYCALHPAEIASQMDTVEGRKGDTNFLLTFQWPQFHFMVVRLIPGQDSETVIAELDAIEREMGKDLFRKAFGLILTDRGKEFTGADGIERSVEEGKRSSVFYCDALQSNQKGAIEKNHVILRYVIPKGTSLDGYDKDQIRKLTCNINSYPRKELGGLVPYDLMTSYFGEEPLRRLGIEKVDASTVNLTPALLNGKN